MLIEKNFKEIKVEEYKNYIKCEAWKNKSKKWRKETNKCEICSSKFRLACHHKTYENLGFETRKDILVLCYWCHKKLHKRLKLSKEEYQKLIKKEKEIIKMSKKFRERKYFRRMKK